MYIYYIYTSVYGRFSKLVVGSLPKRGMPRGEDDFVDMSLGIPQIFLQGPNLNFDPLKPHWLSGCFREAVWVCPGYAPVTSRRPWRLDVPGPPFYIV